MPCAVWLLDDHHEQHRRETHRVAHLLWAVHGYTPLIHIYNWIDAHRLINQSELFKKLKN